MIELERKATWDISHSPRVHGNVTKLLSCNFSKMAKLLQLSDHVSDLIRPLPQDPALEKEEYFHS